MSKPMTADGQVIEVGKEYWRGVDLSFTVRDIKTYSRPGDTLHQIFTDDWETFLLEVNPVYADRKQVIQVEIAKHKKYIDGYSESIKRHEELIRDLEDLLRQ